MRKFWMVYGVRKKPPTKEHYAYEEAVKEATKLARENPGVVYIILEAVVKLETVKPAPPDVILERLSDLPEDDGTEEEN